MLDEIKTIRVESLGDRIHYRGCDVEKQNAIKRIKMKSEAIGKWPSSMIYSTVKQRQIWSRRYYA